MVSWGVVVVSWGVVVGCGNWGRTGTLDDLVDGSFLVLWW